MEANLGRVDHLADQFNALLVGNHVEFEEFVLMLVHSGKSYFGGSSLRDNAIIWLITQVMPLEVVKAAISTNVAKPPGPTPTLPDAIIAFYEGKRRQSEGFGELLDASIACIIWRLRTILKDFTSTAINMNGNEEVVTEYLVNMIIWDLGV